MRIRILLSTLCGSLLAATAALAESAWLSATTTITVDTSRYTVSCNSDRTFKRATTFGTIPHGSITSVSFSAISSPSYSLPSVRISYGGKQAEVGGSSAAFNGLDPAGSWFTAADDLTLSQCPGASIQVSWTFIVDYTPSPPLVTQATPNSGPTTGGTQVTLKGTNLTSDTRFTFYSSSSACSSWGDVYPGVVQFVDAQTVKLTTPPNCPAVASVAASNSYGGSNGPKIFTYLAAPPAITSVTPNKGPIKGGTSVTITGSNLAGPAKVTFGGTIAGLSIYGVDNTHLVVVAPAHAAGPVDVSVSTFGGAVIKSNAFYYTLPAPLTVNALDRFFR